MHFSLKIFGHIKKKQYFCSRFPKKGKQKSQFGRLPEWLGTGLQNRGQRFESATDLIGAA